MYWTRGNVREKTSDDVVIGCSSTTHYGDVRSVVLELLHEVLSVYLLKMHY